MTRDAERRDDRTWLRWLVPLILASVALRVVILLTSPVQTTPDSPGYLALANAIRHATLADDPGERTPVYPLFVALLGARLSAIRVVQMAIGVAVTAALFRLAWRQTRNPRIATLVGACYGLSLTAAIYEDTILTESLATALLVVLAGLFLTPTTRKRVPGSPSPQDRDTGKLRQRWRGEGNDRIGNPGGDKGQRFRWRRALACRTWRRLKPAPTGQTLIPIRITTSKNRFMAPLAIGVLAGLIALTRPVYTFLPVVLMLPFFVLWRRGVPRMVIAQGICCITLPAMLLVGAWSAGNAVRFGVFSPTILTGYNLSNHAGGFIELAPERDALLRDIYLKYRAEAIRETGSYANTIWDARPELLARTGLSNVALSRAFGSLSFRLFLHYPGRYAASVAIAWLRFWNSPGMLRWGGARDPIIGRVIGIVWMIERGIFIAMNVLFLLLTVGAVCARRRRARWQPSAFTVTLCAIVWATSIIQALLEYGSNTRFGVPTQSFVAYVVIVSAASLMRRRAPRRGVLPAIPMAETANGMSEGEEAQ